MALQEKEVLNDVLEDFEPRGSGQLGVNEIIPLVCQARLRPKPNHHQQENTVNVETPKFLHIRIQTAAHVGTTAEPSICTSSSPARTHTGQPCTT